MSDPILECLKECRSKLSDQSEIDLAYIDEVIASATTSKHTQPASNVVGDNAHWQSLLAAQNNVIDGLKAENSRLLEVLRNLEMANDNLCGARPQKIYDAMIAAGMADRMTELDEARCAARAALSTTPRTDTTAQERRG